MRTSLTIPSACLLACCLSTSLIAAEPAEAEAPDASTPEGAIMLSVQAFREADMDKLLASMPESELEQMKAAWEMKRNEPSDPMMDAEFDEKMALLKSDEAVETLLAQMKPQLAQWEQQKQQMAGQLGIVQLMLPGLIAQNPDIPEMQQLNQLTQLVPPMQQWILTAGLGSEEKAREMLTKLHEWAKEQDWATVADLKTKQFDEVVAIADEVVVLGKDIGKVYGIDFNAFLDSVEASSSPGENDDEANLLLSMTILGKNLDFDLPMVKSADGKWELKSADKIEQKMNPLGGGAPGAMPAPGPEGAGGDEAAEEDSEEPAAAPF